MPAKVAFAQQPQAKLEEVVVTAARRKERLQDVSIAVTALSSSQIQATHSINLEGVQAIVPSLTIGNQFNTTFISSRGLGSVTVFGNVDPSVGFYVDDRVINNPAVQGITLFDVKRIEVLRGPQGTLFGRNTIGGAVNVITNKPTEKFEAYAHVTGGKYGLVDTEGAVSGPLTASKGILGRIAWKTTNNNGYGKNEYTGHRIDSTNRKSLRGELRFNFTDDMNFLLTAAYFKENDSLGGGKFAGCLIPNDCAALPPNGAIPPADLSGFADNGNTRTRNIAGNIDPVNNKHDYSVGGTFNWQINDSWSIKNIVGYRDSHVLLFQDLDFSALKTSFALPGKAPGYNYFNKYSKEFSEEFQIHYDGDFLGNRLDAVAGLFYFHEKSSTALNIGQYDAVRGKVRLVGSSTVRIINGVPTPFLRFSSVDTTNSISGYWHFHYNLDSYLPIPGISLKAGGRYTSDHKHANALNTLIVAQGTGPLIDLPPTPFIKSKTFSDYTSEVGLEWRPRSLQNVLLYYTYSEGYESGTSPGGSSTVNFVDPEYIYNHEVGMKSEWFNNRLRVNLAGFHYTVDGLVFQLNLPSASGGSINNPFNNITSLTAKGVEMDFNAAVTDRLRMNGGVAWLDARIGQFSSVDTLNPAFLANPSITPPLIDYTGNRPRRAPEWSASWHGEYDIPAPLPGVLTLASTVSYKSKIFFNEVNNNQESQSGYTIVDASLRYVSPGDRWSLEFWGKNLTDKLYAVERSSLSAAVSKDFEQLFGPPLTWGVTVGVNFD